jgi:DNA replication and repair protein RecF
MDDTLGQVESAYLGAVEEYEKVLPQRNALLRRIAERRGSPKELDFWDEKLVKAGSVIIAERQSFLRELQALAQRAQYELTGNREMLTLRYQPIGLYGSRGQSRTAVMAFKLAELEWMRERIGEWPVLLLDEVAAELDAQRRAYLLERIDGATQTLMTTTELDIFTPDFLKRATIWEVREGQIEQATQTS